MLGLLGEELSVNAFGHEFAASIIGRSHTEIERICREVFQRYGRDWMRIYIEV
jgi:hypothetical protein